MSGNGHQHSGNGNGAPKLRAEWIARRKADNSDGNFSQMHYARKGLATEEMLYIDPVECIDCGACVPVCPVSAIFALDDLPEKWKAFTERNAKYYGR